MITNKFNLLISKVATQLHFETFLKMKENIDMFKSRYLRDIIE